MMTMPRLAGAVAGLWLMAAAQGASAVTLVGLTPSCTETATLTCAIQGPIDNVKGTPEILVSLFGDQFLSIDFMDRWVTAMFDNGGGSLVFASFGSDTNYILQIGGLGQVHPLAGIRAFENDGVANLTVSNLSFDGSTLTIDLRNVEIGSGDSFGFDVAVPLPASAVLLLAGLAGLGLVGRRKAAA